MSAPTRIYDRLFIGNESTCKDKGYLSTLSAPIVTVHACKHPCHVRAVGYTGKLASTHPNYLSLERGSDLYLNLIDPPVPLFKPESFKTFLAFASKRYHNGNVLLIHCNQGESRAPSLALLFLSKELHVIPDDSYQAARAEFEKRCAGYKPGKGIKSFLTEHWNEL